MFSESGGSREFSSKEIFHLAESAAPINSLQRNVTTFASKDRSVIPPVQVNRVLAAVRPQMANSVPKFTQKNIHTNTFTTATVTAPKPSLNVGGVEVKEEIGEGRLESLVQMLKLLKGIPGSLHNPILELVANEILRQARKGGNDLVGSGGIISPHVLSDTVPYLLGTKESIQKSSSSKDMNYVATTGVSTGSSSSQVYRVSTESSSSQVFPVNSYQTQCPPNLPLQVQADSSLTSNNNYVLQQNKLPHQEQSTKVVYPMGGNFFPAREVSKGGEFHNVVFSTQQSCRGTIQTVCQSSPSLVMRSTGLHHIIPQKMTYMTSLNTLPPQQSYSIAQEPVQEQKFVQEQKLTHHEQPISTLMMQTTHALNQGEVKTEGNLLRRGSTHGVHEGSFVLENQNQRNTSEAAFKIENCDPLLSQAANVVTSMGLHTTENLSGAHHPPSEGASMISQTINRGGVNEVPISNFSESELLDYINPTCFDNV